jgi:hypothetical protein
MDTPNESGLLAPAKKRKTLRGGGQQSATWRATARQNLASCSIKSGYNQQTDNRNGNQYRQANFFDSKYVQSVKSTSDVTAARGKFVIFLQDLLNKKTAGAEVWVIKQITFRNSCCTLSTQ